MALWTCVMLAGILIVVMYAMLDMGAAPLDSQLKAQIVDKGKSASAAAKKQ